MTNTTTHCIHEYMALRFLESLSSSGKPYKVQSVQNESYGVLRGDVPHDQSIELKDNAAYSPVQTQSAVLSQSIAVEDNVAYRSVKTDPVYNVPVNA